MPIWIFFCSASSLKQQSVGSHVDPLRHIILGPSQPSLILLLNAETANANFIVFDLIQMQDEPTIYCN